MTSLKKLNKKTRNIVIVVVALLLSGAIIFALLWAFASTGKGVAYDWKVGTSPTYYKSVSSMPDGWVFVRFSSTLKNGKVESFGIWVPVSEPIIGSRNLQTLDTGEDVKALQVTLNAARTPDQNDDYYFDKVPIDGIYDQATTNAVYTLQGFFNQDQSGVADLNFQSSLYKLVTTVN